MLHQMVTDEREDSVREAAVRAMAVVLLHCEDADKFNQVSLGDTSQNTSVSDVVYVASVRIANNI